MRIAILGWGSLRWDPRELKASKDWQEDGPYLPIEFARISDGPRLTLVLYKGAEKLGTLWTYSTSEGLQEAICNLAKRENTNIKNIGFLFIPDDYYRCNVVPDSLPEIKVWAKQKKLDAVIWTDLQSRGIIPTAENVIAFISNLNANARNDNERYVRNAPPQIKTKIRKVLEEEYGWTPTSIQKESNTT